MAGGRQLLSRFPRVSTSPADQNNPPEEQARQLFEAQKDAPFNQEFDHIRLNSGHVKGLLTARKIAAMAMIGASDATLKEIEVNVFCI